MKKNIYQTLLPLVFLLRIMFPIGNAAYLMCISKGKDSVWLAVFVASLLLEVAAMMTVAKGFHAPGARRRDGFGVMALALTHLVAFWGLYLFNPACRQALTLLYMILLTVGYALLIYLVYRSMQSGEEGKENRV